MNPEHALTRWMDGADPEGVEDDVFEAVVLLRPDRAPAPRIAAEDLCAGLEAGPLADRDLVDLRALFQPDRAPGPRLTAADLLGSLTTGPLVVAPATTEEVDDAARLAQRLEGATEPAEQAVEEAVAVLAPRHALPAATTARDLVEAVRGPLGSVAVKVPEPVRPANNTRWWWGLGTLLAAAAVAAVVVLPARFVTVDAEPPMTGTDAREIEAEPSAPAPLDPPARAATEEPAAPKAPMAAGRASSGDAPALEGGWFPRAAPAVDAPAVGVPADDLEARVVAEARDEQAAAVDGSEAKKDLDSYGDAGVTGGGPEVMGAVSQAAPAAAPAPAGPSIAVSLQKPRRSGEERAEVVEQASVEPDASPTKRDTRSRPASAVGAGAPATESSKAEEQVEEEDLDLADAAPPVAPAVVPVPFASARPSTDGWPDDVRSKVSTVWAVANKAAGSPTSAATLLLPLVADPDVPEAAAAWSAARAAEYLRIAGDPVRAAAVCADALARFPGAAAQRPALWIALGNARSASGDATGAAEAWAAAGVSGR